ncbi:MAG: nucleotide exchange factor GrpE [Heteroscytonema crispum UTEX LB 1556]
MSNVDFTQKLLSLMQQVGVSSFKALSRTSGVSERQLLRLRRGEVEQMRVDVLLQLSQSLHISLDNLVETFSEKSSAKAANGVSVDSGNRGNEQELLQQIADLKTEYQRSRQELQQQREVLWQEFQQSSLQLLESFLLQFPTAAQKARENPQLEALKIVPLVETPLKKILQAWGIEAIAPVGTEIPYDPQLHQLMEGTAQPGQTVKVRYTGYRQGDKLLYRAKVSPVF